MEILSLDPGSMTQYNKDDLQLIDCLREDHVRLVGESAILKNAEKEANSDLWQELRLICSRLTLGLYEHIRREDRLLMSYNRSLGAAARVATSGPISDHYGDYRYLQVITHSITMDNRPFLLKSRYRQLEGFLLGLDQHMKMQEEKLFPTIERALTTTAGDTLWDK